MKRNPWDILVDPTPEEDNALMVANLVGIFAGVIIGIVIGIIL